MTREEQYTEAIAILTKLGVGHSVHSSGMPVLNAGQVTSLVAQVRDEDPEAIDGVRRMAYELDLALFQRMARQFGIEDTSAMVKEMLEEVAESTGIMPTPENKPEFKRERMDWDD